MSTRNACKLIVFAAITYTLTDEIIDNSDYDYVFDIRIFYSIVVINLYTIW